MTPADVKDLSVPRPVVAPWLTFVEPKSEPAAPVTMAPSQLRKAA